MFSDYRSFGQAPSKIFNGASAPAATDVLGSTTTNGSRPAPFMHVVVLESAVIETVVLRHPVTGSYSGSMTLTAGAQLANVASFTLTSGTVQVFYFFS